MQPKRYVTTFVRVTSSATGRPQNVLCLDVSSAILSPAGRGWPASSKCRPWRSVRCFGRRLSRRLSVSFAARTSINPSSMSLRRPLHLAIQASRRLPHPQCIRRLSSTSQQPFLRAAGTGEIPPSTPQSPAPTSWYKRPSFRRQLVNVLLLCSFINTTMISMSYKSQLRNISTQAKERQQSLRDAIEKVRKGEPIDLRAALGTGDPEQEKKWDNCAARLRY